MLNVRGAESAAALTPVRLLGSVSFLYLKHNDVYILFVTRQNANAMLAMAFMKQVCPLPPGSWRWHIILVDAADMVWSACLKCCDDAVAQCTS